MEFSLRPTIKSANCLCTFFEEWQVGEGDLVITNEYLLTPALEGKACPCDALYQEQYGKGEPSDEMVDAMLAAAADKTYSRIIALGGGTIIDIAKLFVFGGGLRCEEICARGAELPRRRGLIIIPTTCGTGSEVTGISIVEFKKKQTKLGLAVPALFADEAVLIPALLSTLPFEVFATSSIDALIHAVESTVSPKATIFSRAMGHSAIQAILAGYQKLAQQPAGSLPNKEEMASFLSASTMAGIAFGNAGCAAVHALSYPIGGNFHVPHGKANYIVFRAVFDAYTRLGADLRPLTRVLADVLDCTPENSLNKMFALLEKVYPGTGLASYGVDKLKCEEMAASVVKNQQRLLANNPVPLSQAQIAGIYQDCL